MRRLALNAGFDLFRLVVASCVRGEGVGGRGVQLGHITRWTVVTVFVLELQIGEFWTYHLL